MNACTRLATVVIVACPLLAGAQDPPGNPAAGKAVFLQNCALCHGPEGKGDGPAASGFNPRPANFTEARRLATPEEKQVRIVTNGGASEKLSPIMPAFGEVLSPQQVRDAVAFVREHIQAPATSLSTK